MSDLILSNGGKGKELAELLCKELGIPENVIWFKVEFTADDFVKVECKYIPTEQNK